MRAVIQRVSRASVVVEDAVVGRIGRGLLVLVGVGKDDTEADAQYVADKTATLRIFADTHGKMNLDVGDAEGSVLVVSQFTLLGDTQRGRRPGFDRAAPPDEARRLYETVVTLLKARGLAVETGRFGMSMAVELVNDGPVTILVDSRQRSS